MAFRISVNLEGEFRRRKSVPGKDNRTYRSFTVEDNDGNTTTVSVRSEELWEDVLSCKKGSFYRYPIQAVATDKFNFIELRDAPVFICDEDGEVE